MSCLDGTCDVVVWWVMMRTSSPYGQYALAEMQMLRDDGRTASRQFDLEAMP